MAVKKIRAAITPPAMAVRFLKNASHIRRPWVISFRIVGNVLLDSAAESFGFNPG